MGLCFVLAACGGSSGGSTSSGNSVQGTPSGGWASTGGLAVARDSHTATTLTFGPDAGKTLVAGGFNGTNSFTSCELFDPVSGGWGPAPSMATPRQKHTATVLADGRVLVAGGFSTLTAATASAEIYNPANKTWTATTAMSAPRALHSSTLLPNGKVLVAGGISSTVLGTSPLTSAEVYDPATQTWTSTGTMVSTHQAHTATVLPSGKVLIAGGTFLGEQNAELFTPETNAFASTGAMATSRSFHAGILLPNGLVLIAGGNQSGSPLASAELYDPVAGTWQDTGGMTIARSGITAVQLANGNVLVAAGLTSNNNLASSAEQFNPSLGSWSSSGSVGIARGGHSTTLIPTGQVLVAGGLTSGPTRLNSSVLFTPTLAGTPNSWSATGSLNLGRQFHTATTIVLGADAGKVLASGGSTSADLSSPTDTAETYDSASKTWSSLGTSMTTARAWHTATVLAIGPNAGKILIAGGFAPGSGGSVETAGAELYDPVAKTWTSTGSMANPRGGHGAVLLTTGPNAGKVMVAGGSTNLGTGLITATAELYDPISGTWAATGSMTAPRLDFTLLLLPTGKILAAGGQSTGGTPTAGTDLYDPVTAAWTPTGNLNSARSAQGAALSIMGGTGGKALIIGGLDGLGNSLSSAELYDPLTGIFMLTGSLQQARNSLSATLLPNGNVVAAGGFAAGATALANGERYNPVAGAWTSTANSMSTGRARHAASLLAPGQLLLSGGTSNGVVLNQADLLSITVP